MKEGSLMPKLTLGGNPHFSVLINGLPSLWVSIESAKLMFAQCVVLTGLCSSAHSGGPQGEGRGGGLGTAAPCPIVWTKSLRQVP